MDFKSIPEQWILNKFQSNYSCTTDAIMTKLWCALHARKVHNRFQFHKIKFTDYSPIDMTQFVNFNAIQGQYLTHYSSDSDKS